MPMRIRGVRAALARASADTARTGHAPRALRRTDASFGVRTRTSRPERLARAQMERGGNRAHSLVQAYLGASSSPSAMAGYPIINVPLGNASGVPVGISFIGTAYSEPTLTNLASGFEAATKARIVPSSWRPSRRRALRPVDRAVQCERHRKLRLVATAGQGPVGRVGPLRGGRWRRHRRRGRCLEKRWRRRR
jgi:hypothetical protein